jgi:hypothetical protein
METNEVALESSPLSGPLRTFAAGLPTGRWEGTATELLAALARLAGESVTKERSWPRRPQDLTVRLKRLAPDLRRVGVFLAWPRTGRRRTTVVERGRDSASPASPASPGQDFSGNSGAGGDADGVRGDADGAGGDAEPNPENPQESGADDAGDAGDAESPPVSGATERPTAETYWQDLPP